MSKVEKYLKSLEGFEGFKDSRVQEGFKFQEFKKDSRVQEGFKEFKSSRLKLRSSLQDVAVPQLQLRVIGVKK